MRESIEDDTAGVVTSAGAPGLLRVVPGTAEAGPGGDDEATVLVAGPDGVRHRLRLDAALRAELRRLGPTAAAPAAVGVPLRPRDIQGRIRAGETAEEVAAAAGMTVEQVRRYEGPVLAERAHVASRAREATVRTVRSRPGLEDLVRQRLAARGVEAGALAWDAWRREEQGWAVQVAFRAGGRERRAQWSFDPGSTALDPLDDEARWLTADAEAETAGGRRLSAVRVYDVETDGVVTEVPPVPLPTPLEDDASRDDVTARTLDLLDALRERRGRRLPVLDLEEGDEGWDEDEDDDLVNALLDLPPAAHPPASHPEEAVDPELLALPEPRLRSVPWQHEDTGEGEAVDASGELPAVAERDEPVPAAPRLGVVVTPATGEVAAVRHRPEETGEQAVTGEHEAVGEHDGEGRSTGRSRTRRSSVPSWDEIVFGSPRSD